MGSALLAHASSRLLQLLSEDLIAAIYISAFSVSQASVSARALPCIESGRISPDRLFSLTANSNKRFAALLDVMLLRHRFPVCWDMLSARVYWLRPASSATWADGHARTVSAWRSC